MFDPIVLDERTIVNARVGIENVELGNGTLRASIWGRNVFDQDYNTFGVNFASLGPITEQYGEEASFRPGRHLRILIPLAGASSRA